MFRTFLIPLIFTSKLAIAAPIFQAFEGDGFDDWQTEGSAFGLAPISGQVDQVQFSFKDIANLTLAASVHGGEKAMGSLTSPEFTISEPYIVFLIGGGNEPGKTAAQLLIDGEVVHEATGKGNSQLESHAWDVSPLKGRKAKIRILDNSTGPLGYIAVDHFVMSSTAKVDFPLAPSGDGARVNDLQPSPIIPGLSIPVGSTLTIEATHEANSITSPTALTFDDQGRIYIAETHRFQEGVEDDRGHLYWYLDDLAAKKTADRRALHEKWKEKLPLADLTKNSEIIRRLADTDGDGKLDETKIFAEGFNDLLDGTAAGVFFYEGSLYFACIPKIWALRDSNQDGAADERKVVAEGFGVRVSLSGHDLNGFTLGPDGRIYGTIGDRGLSVLTKEGKSYDYPNEGAAFRFEPDGTGFEIFHTGLRNPKEIAFDDFGNAFSVDNNSDQNDAARIVYLVEGGDSGWQMEHQTMHSFHRQIGLEKRPPSRWMDEKMWEMENSTQPAYMLPPAAHLSSGPSGLTYHPGVGFLESEVGRFLICDYRGGAANSGIWSFKMKPKGAGMEMSDSRPFVWGVAATDVEYSWDGKVFITDFISGWNTHKAGRLLSLDAGTNTWQPNEAKGAAKLIKEGFEKRSPAELANLLKHPDLRIRLRAQIALTRTPEALSRFSEATKSSIFHVRVHGIQGLGIICRRGSSPLPVAEFGAVPSAASREKAEEKLISLTEDKNPEIRSLALAALADSKHEVNNVPIGPLLSDSSLRVRFFAAMLVGKRKMITHYGPICDMLEENDNRDVYLRHAGIFALEQLAGKNPQLLTALKTHESPAVRLAATVALRRMKDGAITAFIDDADPKVADEAIRAITDLDIESRRPNVAELLDDLSKRTWTPFMLRRLIHNAYRVGTPEDLERVIRVAQNPEMPEEVRQEALRLIGEWAAPFPADQLTGIWRPLPQRDVKTFQPTLLKTLPELLLTENFVLTAALEWIEKYDLKVPTLTEDALRGLVANSKLPESARALALNLLIKNQPKTHAKFLAEVAKDGSDEVAIAALTAIAKLSPDVALPTLAAAVNATEGSRASKTWAIIGLIQNEGADEIFVKALEALKQSQGVSPTAIEMLEAARERKSPAVIAALADYDQALSAINDPLVKWNISLEGGDPETGAELFASHPASECMRCHKAEDGHSAGGETAPNLAGIGTRHQDRRFFLEAIMQPSAKIAPGFGAVGMDFKNGATLTGNLIAEASEHLDVMVDGKLLRVLRSDLADFTPPVSPMPSMANALNPRELRDMIAWLASLKKGEKAAPPTAVPTLLDPKTLPIAEKIPADASGIDPAIMKLGRQQFLLCGACHGQNGEGTPAGPPLAGSEWVTGPEENLIRIQLRGLNGPIKVKGQIYTYPAGMAALAYQTDEQIASVLTYIRNSLGNKAPVVTPSAVNALRSEVGKVPLVEADLKPPH